MLSYDIRQIAIFALMSSFAVPAFMLGYIVRGNVEAMGGELELFRKWWKRLREKKDAKHG
jgi:hypothetical protein